MAPGPGVAGRKRWDARLERHSDLLETTTRRYLMPIAVEKKQCPVCVRPVESHHTVVSVHGMTFHAYCAGYKRRAAAA
jgi:hypothetical protein